MQCTQLTFNWHPNMLNIPAWWGREPGQPHFAVVKTLSFLPKSFALAVESINPFSLQRPDPGPRPPPCRSTDAARRSAPNATWNPKKKKTLYFLLPCRFPLGRGLGGSNGDRQDAHTHKPHTCQQQSPSNSNANLHKRQWDSETYRWGRTPLNMDASQNDGWYCQWIHTYKTLQITKWQSVVTEFVFCKTLKPWSDNDDKLDMYS